MVFINTDAATSFLTILFYMREYSDAIKLPKSYPFPPRGGQGLQIK
jgi:hypothetical protein